MLRQKLVIPLAALALVASAGGGYVAAAHADTATTVTPTTQGTNASRPRPAAVGEVTAVHGSTITLTDKMSGTTYTVDASSAQITKHTAPVLGATPAAPTTIQFSDIKVGDMLMVQGTVSGSSIAATRIEDGMFGGRGDMHGPGLMGTVSAVHGSTITVTGKDGKSYTVDASSSQVSKMQTLTVSDIKVGDAVGVEGSVNGTSVTARHIMDGIQAPPVQ